MAFTRFHDDPCRIEKQLQETTGIGRYMLNVPGNGDKPMFMDDPFIRMQKCFFSRRRVESLDFPRILVTRGRISTKLSTVFANSGPICFKSIT